MCVVFELTETAYIYSYRYLLLMNNNDWDIHLSQTACLEMCQDLFPALVSVTTLLGYSSLSDCMPRDVPGFISCTSECNNITGIFISLRLHA